MQTEVVLQIQVWVHLVHFKQKEALISVSLSRDEIEIEMAKFWLILNSGKMIYQTFWDEKKEEKNVLK